VGGALAATSTADAGGAANKRHLRNRASTMTPTNRGLRKGERPCPSSDATSHSDSAKKGDTFEGWISEPRKGQKTKRKIGGKCKLLQIGTLAAEGAAELMRMEWS